MPARRLLGVCLAVAAALLLVGTLLLAFTIFGIAAAVAAACCAGLSAWLLATP